MNRYNLSRKDATFIFLFLSAVILQIFISTGQDSHSISEEAVLSPFEKVKNLQAFNSEESILKVRTTISIFFIIVFSIGLSINFLALAFFIANRKGMKRLLFPPNDHRQPSFFQFKDILYFLCFCYSSIQIFRAVFFTLRETLLLSPDKIFSLNLVTGTLGIQLSAFLFIIIYSTVTYKHLPGYFRKFGKRSLHKLILSFSIFLGMLPWIMLLAYIGYFFSQKLGIEVKTHVISDYLKKNAINLSTLYLIAYAAFGAPFFEEFIFRGFVYTTLKKKWGMLAAVMITSLVFALFHMNFVQFFYIFGLGITLSLVYESTSNLWYPVLLHCTNNILSIILTFMMK